MAFFGFGRSEAHFDSEREGCKLAEQQAKQADADLKRAMARRDTISKKMNRGYSTEVNPDMLEAAEGEVRDLWRKKTESYVQLAGFPMGDKVKIAKYLQERKEALLSLMGRHREVQLAMESHQQIGTDRLDAVMGDLIEKNVKAWMEELASINSALGKIK